MGAGSGKTLVVVGIGAAAAAALVALTGGSAHAETAEPEKKPTPTKVPIRITLAKKFGKVFGVPVSLILAIISAQSSNRPNASRTNKRGGAWGYGQVTLATATEIWPKAKSKIGKEWDGTGKGLLDPTINIGLTAYYLSLWWKRYKTNRLGWLLAAYSYILGPGRVRKAMSDDKGKLPSPLPSDFAGVKKRMATALTTKDVKNAVAAELTKIALSGAEALYGKALGKSIPSTVTGYQARTMIGLMTSELSRSYTVLKNYDPTGLAKATKIDAGSIDAARNYLDSTNTLLAKYYVQMPESNDKLTDDQLTKLRTCASTSSVAVKTVDDLFGTSFWKELATEIAIAAKETGKKLAKTFEITGGVIAAAAIGLGVLVLAIKK